jgi:Ca2+-binding RTX toxin-like protein
VIDTISGKVGMDTLDFSALTAGVTVNLGNHNSTQAVGGGYNLSLPAEDMETVAGSATGANSLTGNSLNGLVIGGAGNDTLVGGSGNEILIGNASDDTLTGGSGNDLLIGGTGGDRLVASNGNNILIAGSTAYDFLGYDPAKAQILTGILAEWNNAAETFDTRHAAIAGQAGSGHLNGGFYLNSTTVFSDTNVDTLTSSSGTNWFFVDNTANNNTPVDIITGTTKKNPYFTYI